MKTNIIIALLIAVLASSCSGRQKFDRIETTPIERYSIVYKDSKCGLYDNQADSLVTAVKYDALKYCGTEPGDEIIHVGNDVFWHCDSLEEIRLPDSIREMSSFHCCRSLRRIVEPKGVSVAGSFAFCTSLRTVVLQEGVTKIADYAFRFCDELCKINFPEGLREIDARASFACTPALKIILKPKKMKIDDEGSTPFFIKYRRYYVCSIWSKSTEEIQAMLYVLGRTLSLQMLIF